jgi:hypothetical protein
MDFLVLNERKIVNSKQSKTHLIWSQSKF